MFAAPSSGDGRRRESRNPKTSHGSDSNGNRPARVSQLNYPLSTNRTRFSTVSTTVMESFVIKTPCSSANIGPGFDVIGLALSVYLELHVTIDRTKTRSEHPLNCRITYEGQGEGTSDISLDPQTNLITRVALYVLRCNDQREFPVETHIHVKNPIPLGRGLGSSGSAVVAGVMLGKEVGGLKHLDNDRLFDYILMIGRFPSQGCRDLLSPMLTIAALKSDIPIMWVRRYTVGSSVPT